MPFHVKLAFAIAAFYAAAFGLGFLAGIDIHGNKFQEIVANISLAAWIISIVIGAVGILIAFSYGVTQLFM